MRDIFRIIMSLPLYRLYSSTVGKICLYAYQMKQIIPSPSRMCPLYSHPSLTTCFVPQTVNCLPLQPLGISPCVPVRNMTNRAPAISRVCMWILTLNPLYGIVNVSSSMNLGSTVSNATSFASDGPSGLERKKKHCRS
jgi:hypothetical protein